MRQLPSYSATSTKKELPVVESVDQGYVVICVPKRPWPTNKTTAVPIRLRTDKNSCRYAYDLQTRQPSHWHACDLNRQDTVPIRLRNKPDNDCAVTPTARATDRADMHAIHRPTDRAYAPAIQRPIDRSSSECSTYYHYLMRAPHCHQNWHLAALPAAAYLGTTILWFYFVLNWFYLYWNIWTGIYGWRLCG